MLGDFKPVYLDTAKCNGCVGCMRSCPTEAIRVRNGKAAIMYERCIGCGECVRHCPTHAKKEFYDNLDSINAYKYKVAVPSPSIYGQFNNIHDTNLVLTAIKRLGFDDVVEGAVGAEYVSAATAEYIKNNDINGPVISSSCPAVVNLILMRYDGWKDNLSPLQQPEEVAANIALAKAQMETGLSADEIGVFVITQCAANVMSLKNSKSAKISGVLSSKELYFPLLNKLNSIKEGEVEKLAMAGSLGVSWGASSGEARGLKTDNYLHVDGIENVLRALNDLEHDRLNGIDFLELYACNLGCVGGSMNVESPFLASTRLRKLRNSMKEKGVSVTDYSAYLRRQPYQSNNVFRLDDDRMEAMKKAMKARQICESLPGINCGGCGAPSCAALAEDLVRGVVAKCRYQKED